LAELAVGKLPALKSVDISVKDAEFEEVLKNASAKETSEAQERLKKTFGPEEETTVDFTVFDLAVLFDTEGNLLEDSEVSFLKVKEQVDKLEALLAQGLAVVNHVEAKRGKGESEITGVEIKTDDQIRRTIERLIKDIEQKSPREKEKYATVYGLLKKLEKANRLGAEFPEQSPEAYRAKFLDRANAIYEALTKQALTQRDITVVTTITVFQGLYFTEPGDFWFTLAFKDRILITSRLLAHVQNNEGELPEALVEFVKRHGEGAVDLVPTVTYSSEELNNKLKAQAEFEIKA